MGQEKQLITLKDMGSFSFGGRVEVKGDPQAGETIHLDHGYAQYFVPDQASDYPIVFWHGMYQSGKCFESTPDGRDGFWQLFVKKNFPVYIIDQPRRGRAGYTNVPIHDEVYFPTKEHEGAVWTNFRIGNWVPPRAAMVNAGSQFPLSPSAVDQFFRSQTPDTGDEPITPEHNDFMAEAMEDMLKMAGPSILFVHSQAGKYGWASAIKAPELVKGVVTYEPGHFFFPDDYVLEDLYSPLGVEFNKVMAQYTVPKDEWMKLTKIPIFVYYGDYVNMTPSDEVGDEVWRFSLIRAKQFVELINENGGNAHLFHLPECGIYGNGHIGFAEKNNTEIADHLQKNLEENGLAPHETGYDGPTLRTLDSYTIPLDGK